MPLEIPGTVLIPRQDFAIQIEVAENRYNNKGDWLDSACLTGPLELRNWRPGDQFTRVGRSGRGED